MRLPQVRPSRHQCVVGTAHDGSPVAFSVLGRNFPVVGDSYAGKSWATGLVCEQMILQGYCVCVIDPEGDYGGLESLPGVLMLGGADHPPELPDVTHALRHFDLSVVIDLSRVGYEEKLSYLKTLLPMLASLRRSTGLTHRIIVDEAHYFLCEADVRQLLDFELGAYTIVTYRPSDIHPDLRKDLHLILVKRLTEPNRGAGAVNYGGKQKPGKRVDQNSWSTKDRPSSDSAGTGGSSWDSAVLPAFAWNDPAFPS